MRRGMGLLAALGALTFVAGSGCRGKRATPEEQVRAAIADAERAVEDKDLKKLGRVVSEQYADKDRNDRQMVMTIVKLQFLRFPSIHLLVRVKGVSFPEPGRAQATAVVAMASLPFGGPAEFLRVNADLYRFELVFADEGKGQWRLRSATWAPARADDFL